MRHVNLLFLFLLFFSCHSDKISTRDVISKKILLFEMFQKSHFYNIRINILRITKNTKQFEYELRKKGISGFALFQTNPSPIIFKNIHLSPINIDIVQKIRKFNEDENIVLLFMENNQNGSILVFKVYEKKIILFNGDLILINTNYLKSIDKIYKINKKWNYVIKPFIGER